MNVLSEVEIARLWSAYGELEFEADPHEQVWWRLARTLTFVALGTAMRRGELLALRWRDVQLLDGRLSVRAALVKGRFTIHEGQSDRRAGPSATRAELLPAAPARRSSRSRPRRAARPAVPRAGVPTKGARSWGAASWRSPFGTGPGRPEP